MDIRHPLKDLDEAMITWSLPRALPMHILLNKADKLSRNQAQQTLLQVKKSLKLIEHVVTVQIFSATKKEGLLELITVLNKWFFL